MGVIQREVEHRAFGKSRKGPGRTLERMSLSKGKVRLIERLRNPRLRPREEHYVAEGVRGVQEVLRGALEPEIRFTLVSPRLSRGEGGRDLMNRLRACDSPLEEVSDDELASLSDTEQPQGVLCVVREPRDPLGVLATRPLPCVLLLDGIQDPGNVGTLIRAARAFGLSGDFGMEGTVDPFNSKVVRASAGALAHLPVARLPWADAADWLAERNVPLFVGDAEGESVRGVDGRPPWALVVGNEGAGPRKEVLEKAAKVLAIPMEPGVDSLNAGLAGAILLFSLRGP